MQSQNQFEPEWVKKHQTATKRLSDCVELREFLWQTEKVSIYLCCLWPGLTVWVNEVYMHSLP